jgi:hypothetical protein
MSTSLPALAESGHGHEGGAASHAHGEGADLSAKTLDELLGKVDDTMNAIAGAIARHELSGIHDLSSELSALTKVIPGKAAADKKQRVEGTSRNIAALSDELHVAADKKDKASLDSSFKKLQGLVALLKTQVH